MSIKDHLITEMTELVLVLESEDPVGVTQAMIALESSLKAVLDTTEQNAGPGSREKIAAIRAMQYEHKMKLCEKPARAAKKAMAAIDEVMSKMGGH